MRMRELFTRLVLTAALLVARAPAARATWPPDAASAGAPVCTATGTRAQLLDVMPDSTGGTLACWADERTIGTTGRLVYAQRVNVFGDALWGADGTPVSGAPCNTRSWPNGTGDGTGGMFVAWFDSLRGGVFAQHLDGSGTRTWPANGSPAHADPAITGLPRVLPDGAGGVYVAFLHRSPANAYTIRIQRFGPTGNAYWGNGVTLATTGPVLFTSLAPVMEVVPDGAGGCIVVWYDLFNLAVRVQRVSSYGVPQWTGGGVNVAPGHATMFPAAQPDGAGGVFIAYMDGFPAAGPQTYGASAQRLSSTGAPLWTAGGVAIAAPDSFYNLPVIAPDGSGGVFVGVEGWYSQTVHVQRLSAAGALLWPAPGTVLSTMMYGFVDMVEDGSGGVVTSWTDTSNVARAQRVGSSGVAEWAAGGVAVFSSPGRHFAQLVRSPGVGVLLVSTSSAVGYLPLDNGSVYEKLLGSQGALGPPPPTIVSVRDIRGDHGGKVAVAWNASPLEASPLQPVTAYHVWQANPGQAYVLVATAPAHGFAGYGYVAATLVDSTAAGNPLTSFEIEAWSAAGVSSFSAPVSGYSVDNLPPYAPAPLPALIGSFGVRVRWLPSDGATSYRLYRGVDAGFTPGEANLVATLADTGYVDPAGAGATFKVVAVDARGNASPATTLDSRGTLGLSPPELPRELALSVPVPNPVRAGGIAVLRFALPAAGPVTLALYDVSGRQVRVLAQGPREAGVYSIPLAGGDDRGKGLPAGLYFARLIAEGRALVRRLVVTP